MIRIDKLHLRLPHGFAPRAETIGRLVGQSLGRISTGGRDRRIRRLNVSGVSISDKDSDQDIAATITRHIIQTTGLKND